jgi:hypothetical protein
MGPGTAQWGDYNNDGRLDILMCGMDIAGTYTAIYENNGLPAEAHSAGLAKNLLVSNIAANTPPAVPTNLQMQKLSATSVKLSWNAASDAETPAGGLNYALRVGTTPGGCDVLAPTADAGGVRRLAERGLIQGTSWTLQGLTPGRTYYSSVQAVDTGMAGSAFATEKSFATGALAAPTFTLNSPTSGTYSAGTAVPIQWSAGNVPGGSTIALCYDPDTVFNGNETWLTYNQAAANGFGSYSWDTTGVTPGSYYVGGYLYANGSPTYSHLTGAVTIRANTPAFTLTAPTSGTFSVGQTLAIQWTAANVATGSTIALCYDTDPLWGIGAETWITFSQTAANGSGSYNWNTTGVTPGTYYIAGYLYSGGTPTYSHILQSITIQTAPSPPTFALLSPTSGTFTAGQAVQIAWSAGNVSVGGTIALCYDTDAVFNGNETWVTFSQAAANGFGTYNWNTAGVTPGTYYIGGYLYLNGTPTYSHLTQAITVQAGPAPTFSLTSPTYGTFTVGQTVPILWTANNAATGSTVALCYDTNTGWGSGETWITFSQAAANGSGSYSWNTTGVTPGTYYVGGYLYSSGKPTYSHLTQSFSIAAPLVLATPESPPIGQPLSADEVLNNENQLAPIVSEAIRRWAVAGGSQLLADVSVRIADLPGNLLGETIGRTVLIDRDAAGYGWFVDPTPRDDAEFTPLPPGALVAQPQSAADRRADLLTTVMHEMGHVLGYRDGDEGLMSAALPLGVRWPSAADRVFAELGARP